MSKGFTLIEMLVAMALFVVVVCVIGLLLSPMRRAFDRGLSSGDFALRARAALPAIAADVRNAGSGVVIGPADRTLDDVVPVVAVVSPSTLRVTRATGAQGVLRQREAVGAVSVRLDTREPCSEQDATCAIRAGDVVAIFDGSNGQTASIANVISGSATLQLATPLVFAFDRGAVVATIEQTTVTLRNGRLVRISAGGAEQPIADRVSGFRATVVGSRLDVQLRLDPISIAMESLELRTSVGFRR